MTATVTVDCAGESTTGSYVPPGAPPADGPPASAVALSSPSGTDDTATLLEAALDALAGSRERVGPTGSPQGVVYLPAAAQPWLINHYVWPSDLCLAVDAGAMIQLPEGAGISGGQHLRAAMFLVGAESNNPAPISNVSLITVGADASSAAKQAFLATDPALAGVDLAHCFTTNHDAEQTGATNNALAVDLCAVTGFEISGLFQIHNNTNVPDDGGDDYPTSSICGLAVRAAAGSPLGDPTKFVQPRQGRIGTLAAWNSPRGYGPVQINACGGPNPGDGVAFGVVASVGGTAFRVETDGSLVKISQQGAAENRGATVDGLTCDTAICAYGNRAASFTPHGQLNGFVHLRRAVSVNCFQTVVASRSGKQGGQFGGVTVDEIVATGGQGAQGQGTTNLWTVTGSDSAISIDGGLEWLANLHLPTPTRIGAFATAK